MIRTNKLKGSRHGILPPLPKTKGQERSTQELALVGANQDAA
jgi:hypothetical protein